MRALRVGSPNSFKLRRTKAAATAQNEWQNSNARGNSVKFTKVATTKGFLVPRSASQATGT